MTDMKLGLGTVQFGMRYGISNHTGQVAGDVISAILKHAQRKGVKIIDTAAIYGTSETELGRNDLSFFNIVSKFMPPVEYDDIRTQLVRSLIKLNIPSLYGYLAHRPGDICVHTQQWKQLQEVKNEGLVQKIGFSVNTPDELSALLGKGFIPDIIQAPFNYFDQRFKPYLIELKKNACEIHTRSVFLQGLFFSDVKRLSTFFDPIKPLLSNLQQSTSNLPAALINYVVGNPFIDKVIIGIENLAQFKAGIESLELDIKLPELKDVVIPDNLLMPSYWPKN